MSGFTFGLWLALGLPLVLGLPLARWLNFRTGLSSLGMAAACGSAVLLVLCRGLQMLGGMASMGWPLLALCVLALGMLLSMLNVRRGLTRWLRLHALALVIIALLLAVLAAGLNLPILLDGALQFDGSRNADSFTFTSSARYMLGHAFDGAWDFDPDHPLYAISRAYFGAQAMQPRPAAEGLLAWLSVLRQLDPIELYNGVQTAGVLLAGLSVLAFVPAQASGLRRHPGRLLVLLTLALACPLLLRVGVNSNFANAWNLAPATGYLALGALPIRGARRGAAVLCLGALLSGYPELLIFVGSCRGLGALLSLRSVGWRRTGIALGWLAAELALAAALLPWATLASLRVYATSMAVSHQGASELVGPMYAGVPLAVAAAIALALAWRGLSWRARSLSSGILLSFGAAQLAMMARGFSYGGFKLSEYLGSGLLGVILISSSYLLKPSLGGRLKGLIVPALALVTVACVSLDVQLMRRCRDFAEERHIGRDELAVAKLLHAQYADRVVLLGDTPAPFYYGMWMVYVCQNPLRHNFSRDPMAAGYLSPYLHTVPIPGKPLPSLRISIDHPRHPTPRRAEDLLVSGAVHLALLP